jgi:toxin YoeB
VEYSIKFSSRAKNDSEKYKQAGDKSALKKINNLLEELEEHPETGTGKPEQLKRYINRFSRRITGKHRLVYEIQADISNVLIVSMYGHYDDE